MNKLVLLKICLNLFVLILVLGGVFVLNESALLVATGVLVIFFINRDQRLLHPSNMVFAFYAMYLILPICLFYVLEFISWEYILPWGRISNWDQVSPNAFALVFCTFSLLFLSLIFFNQDKPRLNKHTGINNIYVPYSICISLIVILIFGMALFVSKTGGIGLWLSDYSNTYVSGKSGVGWLNFLLINYAHFVFFICGIALFSKHGIKGVRRQLLIFLLIFSVVVVCYFQGIKSRVPILALFFLFPVLINSRLKMFNGVVLFLAFISFFMVSMYFRSNGFYDSFPKLVEYLLSYFNTYILLDTTMNDFPSDYMRTLWFSSQKYTQALGYESNGEYLDISYWLTDVYFPETWERNATQQWPLEMELYFNFGGLQFFVLPVLLISVLISYLYNRAYLGSHILSFIFIAEFIRIFSTLRGSMLPWTLPLVLIFYICTCFFMIAFTRKVNNA
ncbi:hypothetical protein DBZ36_11225 [Alginatibacterium sediminis]|uniref:Oligosaccharide repeat unit polymerase n=1 Tax=Alginatibacterium sediminis TaxID=2164068 RepID=A0A420EAZ4_9ALTE|nr:O-antigen polymerase [Alginatibacterium sediminis]RKF17824.1 hypothetical protein DBZ36_11225 [Alginatibacterium sediminis]